MKKILGGICVASALLTVCATASAELAIEGESYQSAQGGHASVLTDGNFSGGRYAAIQYNAQDGDYNELVYNVLADKEGWYSLIIDGSAGDTQWTSDFSVKINGGAAIKVSESAQLTNSSNTSLSGTMRKIDMGCVWLKEGKNSVSIIVNEKRKADSQICCYIDKLSFNTPIHGIREVNEREAFAIYEKGTDVKYDVVINYPEAKEEAFEFKLTDYWGNSVKSGTATVAPNATKYTLSLGELDCGWYSLSINDKKSGKSYQKQLSVVPSLASRMQVDDSPFAMDFASGFETFLHDDYDNYLRALRLCGPSMVRERLHSATIASEKYENYDKWIDKLSSAGLKILGCTHGGADKTAENIFDHYTAAKHAVEHYEGKIQAWEFGNEPELSFQTDPADRFSVYVKASALGVIDSGVDVLTVSGGMTEPTNILSGGCADFIESYMMNDAMKFTDIYGYHSYGIDHHLNIAAKQTATHTKNKREGAFIYGDGKPLWLTEGGLMFLPKTLNNADAREAQARAVVKLMVESCVEGDSKHFWFIFGPRRESLGDFGLFDYDTGMTLPSYAAYANMTYVLGSGEYKGRVDGLPEGTDGYVFNNSQKDVAVLWSDRASECTLKASEGVTVINLMGTREHIAANADGSCTVAVSQSPCYVIFENGIAPEDFLADENFDIEYERTELTEAERVIIDPIWQGEAGTKISGYGISANGQNEMLLNVYNFNEKEISGRLVIEVNEGFSVSQTELPMTIPGMDRAQTSILISLTEDAVADKQGYLSYRFVTDSGESTPTVSVLRAVCDTVEVEPDMIIPGSNQAEMWDVSNVLQGSQTSAVNMGDGVEFNIKFASGDKWFYPRVDIEDGSIFADKTGICYTYYADEKLAASGSTMYIMVWLSDGRQYFLDSRVPFKEGWHQVQRPWDSFTLMSSPLGALDIRVFDPTLITKFSIGTNASLTDVTYTLKDIGTYISAGEKHNDKFIVSGIADGEVYEKGSVPEATVEIPYNTDYETIRVKTGTTPYDNWKIEDGVIKIDLNKLERGYYSIYVYGRHKEMSHYRRSVVNITIK